IGNSEAKTALKKYADMLFLYDAKTKKNPISESTHIPRTVFMYARPGTGKTSIASAARNYMSGLSEKTGKKFSWVPIDSSIKKKWYGETEEILKSKVEKAMNPDNIGVIFIDDIDGLVISRSDESSNAPDKSMTIYLMQLIEGIDTPYYGNYMIISASNKPGDLDDALIERIGEASFNVPGPKTKREYSEFLKIKLEKGIKSGYVRISENEWEKAAELCMKYSEELSPRDLTKAMRMLQDEALKESALEGLCDLPYPEQKRRINLGFERIGINELAKAIENRYHNEMSQREVTYESEIKKIKESIVKEKKAIEIAAKELAESEKNGNV
ncbi:MAG: AAA family ATPase, partial [Candidatus Woesearchaeota archaeon]|nr:AAA family ATPase [Candidatus Woesearchaeota archaeon]